MNKNNQDIFKEHGFCIVRNAISNEVRDIITQYALFDEMQDFKAEGFVPDSVCVPNAHSKYADPAMESVLIHLHETVQNNVGFEVTPTYSYYRVYRNGDDLKPHKDRPSCEISTTLCFNYEYTNKDYQWPIYMDGTAVVLYPGDMVIYRGCDLEHWREAFESQKEDWHVQGFFHYVDNNGPYTSYKFDGRETIGQADPKDNASNNVVESTSTSEKSYIQWG
jgi:hypothetical protein